jgi:TetR/AcrR family transcriptional regulator
MAGEKNGDNRPQMKLADLARESGFSVSTLYDYLKSGLLPHPEKESPTKSYFTDEHRKRLEDVRTLKDQGLSMAEIKARLAIPRENDTREDVDEVRVAIVDKALELFSTYHYENTKISDITQALNMGNGTFYRYFKSKEELFLDCLERLPKVMVPRDAWIEVEKETDYIKRLKKRGYAMLNAFPSYIGILNYAKLALGGTDETLARKAAECIRSMVLPLQEDLGKAIEYGHVRQVDAEMCAYLLLGINETFGYLLLMNPDLSVDNEFGIIEDFIRHALMKRPGDDGPVVNAELTDRSGNILQLKALNAGPGGRLSGMYLEGELHAPLSDFLFLEMEDKESHMISHITLKSGEVLDMSVPPDTEFSGRTPFGLFHIKARKIQQIRFVTPQ